ncbi:MAG: L-seryl-tRNA(Sec) selenium transferase [Clostridiales bacterium]|nr:L-seryl-tRNA(Sec) selenium transferase [Clostridiales bacterium]
MKKTLLRQLPKVDYLINNDEIQKMIDDYPRKIVLKMINETLDEIRKNILSELLTEAVDEKIIIDTINNKVANYLSFSLKRVINGTGVIIHTNLGRSIINYETSQHTSSINNGYSNLEFDIESGKRGLRYTHIEKVLMDLTGAEGALVVNNNAAAVMLVLNTVAKDKEAIVSRGELVEIGRSFRVPEVMKISGGTLIEVGTTNKTHLKDFENNINDNTGAILKVHTSNYKILGFTKEVPVEDLVALGKEKNIPVVLDLGSGTLIDLTKYGLSVEPTVLEQVGKGLDIITFSGDKLLGGPQAGIIVGKKKYIDAIKKNQLTRALRVGKMTISALESTLRYYFDEKKAIKEIPTLRMIAETYDSVNERANKLLKYFDNKDIDIRIIDGESQVGGGTFPLDVIPSALIEINSTKLSVSQISSKLRNLEVPIITRISENRILLDIRTLQENDFEYIASSINNILE